MNKLAFSIHEWAAHPYEKDPKLPPPRETLTIKVTDTVNRLQNLTMEGILGVDRVPGSANVQNLTLT